MAGSTAVLSPAMDCGLAPAAFSGYRAWAKSLGRHLHRLPSSAGQSCLLPSKAQPNRINAHAISPDRGRIR
jgi:hypothetical protein